MISADDRKESGAASQLQNTKDSYRLCMMRSLCKESIISFAAWICKDSYYHKRAIEWVWTKNPNNPPMDTQRPQLPMFFSRQYFLMLLLPSFVGYVPMQHHHGQGQSLCNNDMSFSTGCCACFLHRLRIYKPGLRHKLCRNHCLPYAGLLDCKGLLYLMEFLLQGSHPTHATWHILGISNLYWLQEEVTLVPVIFIEFYQQPWKFSQS